MFQQSQSLYSFTGKDLRTLPDLACSFFVTEVDKNKHLLQLKRASSKPTLNVLSEAAIKQ